jgi:hypothetical protein
MSTLNWAGDSVKLSKPKEAWRLLKMSEGKTMHSELFEFSKMARL